MTERKIYLPRGAVSVRRLALTSCFLTLLLLGIVLWWWLARDDIPLGPLAFGLVGVLGLLVLPVGAWILAVASLKGQGKIPFVVVKREPAHVAAYATSLGGWRRKAVQIAPGEPVQLLVRLFQEQAEGTKQPRLVTVLSVTLLASDTRLGHFRGMADSDASGINWRAWSAEQFGSVLSPSVEFVNEIGLGTESS